MRRGFCICLIYLCAFNNVGSNLLPMNSVHVYQEDLIQPLIIHFGAEHLFEISEWTEMNAIAG